MSIVENTTAVVQLRASDPDGDDLTFSIVSGKDSALFAFIGTEGNLEFLVAPSFEDPQDSNGDNIYEIDVRVSDGRLTATQTIRVTVTNSGEGIDVKRLATGLGANGSVKWLAESQKIFVVSGSGNVQFVDPTSGAVTSNGQIGGMAAGATVLGIGVDGLDFRGGYFFALVREGLSIQLRYVSSITPTDQRTLWSYTYPSGSTGISASINMRGNNPRVALSDGGQRDAAQDRNDPRGNIMMLNISGDIGTPASLTVSAGAAGWGLRSPLLLTVDNEDSAPIDRGASYNEFNFADFELANFDANFEWPIRDGLVDASYSGTVTGTRIAPFVTQQHGVSDVGRWTSGGGGLQAEGWTGVMIFGDENGNIFAWDRIYFGNVENVTADFEPDVGMFNSIVSMDDTDYSYGPSLPLLMLDSDGELFVVRVTN